MSERRPGFYRLRWNGQMAVGYLHPRDEPTPWRRDRGEQWSILFIHSTLAGDAAAYTLTRNIAEADIGERIDET